MSGTSADDLTANLNAYRHAGGGEQNAIAARIIVELHQLARGKLDRVSFDRTLQPTLLAHDAFAKLFLLDAREWEDRSHFFKMAARVIQNQVIDHARKRATRTKHVGQNLDSEPFTEYLSRNNVLAIDVAEAMTELETLDAHLADVMRIRYFVELPVADIAALLGIPKSTIEKSLKKAKTVLLQIIERKGP